MKLPFKKDPVAQLAKVRTAAAAGDAKLAELESQRANALAAGAEIDEIRTIGRAMEELRRDQRIFADQIASLIEECRKLELARREREKVAAVAVLEKLFGAQLSAAVEVEKALAHLSETYATLETARRQSWNCAWDNSLLPDTTSPYSPFRRDTIGAVLDARIGDLLGITRGTVSGRLTELGKRSAGMSTELANFVESYVRDLRAAPLPELFVDEQDEAAA